MFKNISEKQQALQIIMDNYSSYTIDSVNKNVTLNVTIAYDIGDIEEKITMIETELNILEGEVERENEELSINQIQDLNDSLELLKNLLIKLN